MNFRGIFLHPYEFLSSAVDFASVAEMSLLVGLAIGLTEANLLKRSVFGPQSLCILHRQGPLHPSTNDPGQLPLYRLFNSSLDTEDLMGRCFIANLLYFH